MIKNNVIAFRTEGQKTNDFVRKEVDKALQIKDATFILVVIGSEEKRVVTNESVDSGAALYMLKGMLQDAANNI